MDQEAAVLLYALIAGRQLWNGFLPFPFVSSSELLKPNLPSGILCLAGETPSHCDCLPGSGGSAWLVCPSDSCGGPLYPFRPLSRLDQPGYPVGPTKQAFAFRCAPSN
jgi:hypothetical protein